LQTVLFRARIFLATVAQECNMATVYLLQYIIGYIERILLFNLIPALRLRIVQLNKFQFQEAGREKLGRKTSTRVRSWNCPFHL